MNTITTTGPLPAADTLTEAQVRALRDRVYGHISSDRNWERCKESWMDPANIRWLQAQDQRTPARLK